MFSFDSIYNCSEHVNLYRQQQQARRERRPDRAVYIPRARRSQTTPPTTTTQIQQQPPAPPPPSISAQVSTANGTTVAVGTITTTATTANYTSKSLNQQLAITLDDTTAASVNDKPSSDEVGKTAGSGSNTTKKREKLSKDTRERREQRLSKKFLSAQQNHNSKNNTKSNENTKNKTSDDEFSPQTVIVIAQKTATPSVHPQQSSSPTTDVVNSIEENLSPIATTTTTKVFNCDREQEQERVELLLNESSEYCIDLNRMKESRVLGNYLNINQNDNLAINEFEAAHLLSPPGDEPTDTVRKNFANISNNPFTNITNDINTMPKPSNKAKSHKASSGVDNAKVPNLRIEDVAATQPTKCDIEEQELQRASKVCV